MVINHFFCHLKWSESTHRFELSPRLLLLTSLHLAKLMLHHHDNIVEYPSVPACVPFSVPTFLPINCVVSVACLMSLQEILEPQGPSPAQLPHVAQIRVACWDAEWAPAATHPLPAEAARWPNGPMPLSWNGSSYLQRWNWDKGSSIIGLV